MYMKGIFDKFPSAGHFYWFQDSKIEGKIFIYFQIMKIFSTKMIKE